MKKFLSLAILGLAASAAVAQTPEYVYDFVPQVQQTIYQQIYDNELDSLVSQVRIDVKFDEDVWWVSGFSGQCYLLDKEGNKYDGWYPDFSGPASDYSLLYFGVNGLNQYVDADYTLVVPQGLLGNTSWYYDVDGARSNPELRYDFNVWKLAGCPREDKTAYDFSPVSDSYSVEEVRINGQRTLELQLSLEFPEAVAIYSEVKNKISVYDGEGNYLQEAVVRTFVDEQNPNKAIVGLRGVDLKTANQYTISIWQGAFGTLEWAAEDYCEGQSNPPLKYDVVSGGSGVEAVEAVGVRGAMFNLNGMRVDSDRLSKGIYVQDGKKVVVK